jgi:hypothetical protein
MFQKVALFPSSHEQSLARGTVKPWTMFRLQAQDKQNKCKAIPVTGHGGPLCCETSRLPHFLDNQLTAGSKVVSLTCQLEALYLQEDSWYSFLLEAKSTPGPQCSWKELGQLKNPMTSLGIESATFWLVAQCLNQLRYHVSSTKE